MKQVTLEAGSIDLARADANGTGTGMGELLGARIMMVDDEPITMEVVQTFLEEAGYEHFIVTERSTEALGLLDREKPDVLLLDLKMPEVSGFDILTAMRADPKLKHVPVIVLTSSTDAQTKLQALELGATDFLGKPVDPSELVLRLRNTLAAKAYQDHLAYYDALTGLPNRRMFLERVGWAVSNARREERMVAILHIGLDRFKQVNDTLGPRAGDAVLAEVAQRLQRCVRTSDSVASLHDTPAWKNLSRLGGDEFAVLLTDIESLDSAAVAARRVLSGIAEVFQIGNHEVYLTPSIGIAAFPSDGLDTDVLIKHAGSALHHAKEQGGDTYGFYTKEMNARSLERLRLANDLRRAAEQGQLVLYYQPKVDAHSGRLRSVEALLRWRHPELGMVSPGEFIPIAEETGLIEPVGEWILHEACRQNRAWQDQGLEPFSVAVNLSAQQFRHRTELTSLVGQALDASGLSPRYLTLELTESMVMENARSNVHALNRIKQMGPRLSIDDFGTGYSSLSYLRRFPLDELKIDMSFVRELERSPDDVAIVTAIIMMAHSLGLSVVAEGVESERQARILRERGCDEYQGYLYSRPLPPDELVTLLEDAGGRLAPVVDA